LCKVNDIIGKDASLYKLSCEFGVLNACYDMGDIELLTRKVETIEIYFVFNILIEMCHLSFIIIIITLNKTPSPHEK
jgi:hypothetical protein